jgi:hypothetical protein
MMIWGSMGVEMMATSIELFARSVVQICDTPNDFDFDYALL